MLPLVAKGVKGDDDNDDENCFLAIKKSWRIARVPIPCKTAAKARAIKETLEMKTRKVLTAATFNTFVNGNHQHNHSQIIGSSPAAQTKEGHLRNETTRETPISHPNKTLDITTSTFSRIIPIQSNSDAMNAKQNASDPNKSEIHIQKEATALNRDAIEAPVQSEEKISVVFSTKKQLSKQFEEHNSSVLPPAEISMHNHVGHVPNTMDTQSNGVTSNVTTMNSSNTECIVPYPSRDEKLSYLIKETHTFLFSPVLLTDNHAGLPVFNTTLRLKEKNFYSPVTHTVSATRVQRKTVTDQNQPRPPMIDRDAHFLSLPTSSGAQRLKQKLAEAASIKRSDSPRSVVNQATPLVMLFMFFFYTVRKIRSAFPKHLVQDTESPEEAPATRSGLVDEILVRSALTLCSVGNREIDLQKRIVKEWSPLIPLINPMSKYKHGCHLLIRKLTRLSAADTPTDKLLKIIEQWTSSILQQKSSPYTVTRGSAMLMSMIEDLYLFLQVKYELPSISVITLLPFVIANASVEDICCEKNLGRIIFAAEAKLGDFFEEPLAKQNKVPLSSNESKATQPDKRFTFQSHSTSIVTSSKRPRPLMLEVTDVTEREVSAAEGATIHSGIQTIKGLTVPVSTKSPKNSKTEKTQVHKKSHRVPSPASKEAFTQRLRYLEIVRKARKQARTHKSSNE